MKGKKHSPERMIRKLRVAETPMAGGAGGGGVPGARMELPR